MPIVDSPAVQALLDEQADALITDIYGHVEDLEPRDFVRWLSERMYEDARVVANLSRTEQESQR